MDRWYISRAALLNASRKGPDGLHKIDGLERMARRIGLALPRMPRHWHGYRLSLVSKLSRWVSRPVNSGWGC
jgi:hypothetical protein